jgi:hypothetical protein
MKAEAIGAAVGLTPSPSHRPIPALEKAGIHTG